MDLTLSVAALEMVSFTGMLQSFDKTNNSQEQCIPVRAECPSHAFLLLALLLFFPPAGWAGRVELVPPDPVATA